MRNENYSQKGGGEDDRTDTGGRVDSHSQRKSRTDKEEVNIVPVRPYFLNQASTGGFFVLKYIG
jgi:hypothetical protein